MIINPLKIIKAWILTEMFNQEEQVQQNGIDLTAKTIKRVISHWTMTTKDRDIAIRAKDSLILDEKDVLLPAWVYEVEFNEQIKIPNGMCAQIIQRSSVNRNGVIIQAGLYDAWFSNYVWAMIYVLNPLWFRVWMNARLAQIIFYEAEEWKLYDGIYNKEKTNV